MSPLGASLLAAALLAIAFAAGYEALFGTARVAASRLADLRRWGAPVALEQAGPRKRRIGGLATRMPLFGASAQRHAGRLAAAGFLNPQTAQHFALVRLVCAAVAMITIGLAGAALGANALDLACTAIGGSIAAAYLPVVLLCARVERRRLRITHELADILDLVGVCVHAGLALREAITLVGDEAAAQGHAIGAQMRLITAELATGIGVGQALRNAAERTGLEELRQLAAVIVQSEQLGSQVGRALRASAEMIRRKRRLAAEAAAQKIALKIFVPLVLFILPAMLIVLLAPALIEALRTFSS